MGVVDAGVREGEQRLAHGHAAPDASALHGRVLVVEDGHTHYPLRRGVAQVGGLQLRGQLPLPLVPPVLEPDLYLRLRQVQGRGQARALRAAQVALHVEGGLQLEHLAAGEHRARLLLAARLLVVVPLLPLLQLVLLGLLRVALLQDDLIAAFAVVVLVVLLLVFGVRLGFEHQVRRVSVRARGWGGVSGA